MSPSFYLLLALLGAGSGIVSGLLGIGGAIIIVPVLLYLPEWLGFDTIEIKRAAAIAVAQVVAASLTGALMHGRHGHVHRRLLIYVSVASTIGALAGGVISAYAPSDALLIVAALLATTAAALMLLPRAADAAEHNDHAPFNPALALGSGAAIGLLIGLIGIGSFLMVPAMIFLLRQRTRVAMATVLAVAFPTALAGLIGKFATNQVPLWESVAIVIGAIPGAQIGSIISARLQPRLLRALYAALVIIIASGLWYDVFNTRAP
ncbi:MAG: sulfite exporter TauE/SafE family protein [Chloroflexota bacterium]